MESTESILKLKGIGPKTAEAFRRLSVATVGDLLSYLPKRYETYAAETPIAAASEGRTVTFSGTFSAVFRTIRARFRCAGLTARTFGIRFPSLNMLCSAAES